MRAVIVLFLLGASFTAEASPKDGFRAGLRMPIATGDQRALVPTLGLGVETRLDRGLVDWPLGFALVFSYDEFAVVFDAQFAELPGGGAIALPQSQSLSYSNFLAAATLRGEVGPLQGHADLGAGISVGFFNGVKTARDPEVFITELMLAASGSAGLSLLVGERGVVDLSARYQRALLNNKLVSREGNELLVFDDLISLGLTAGYLF